MPFTHPGSRRLFRRPFIWRALLVVAGLSTFVAGWVVCCLYEFMAPTRRIPASVLVVEGWLPEYALEEAIEEFRQGGYQTILTTGGRLYDDYRMFVGGTLLFSWPDSTYQVSETDSVIVEAAGSQIDTTFAHFVVLVNGKKAGEAYTKSQMKHYRFALPPGTDVVQSVMIRYDNDAVVDNDDRDLYVLSVRVGRRRVKSISEGVWYDRGKLDGKQLLVTANNTYAESAAARLWQLGMDSAAVIPLPSEAINVHRTYNSAAALKPWLQKHRIRSINVFSQGAHARRTWITYERAMGDAVQTGIIATPDERYDAARWWRSKTGLFTVLGGAVKASYIWLLFFPEPPE